MISLSFTYFTMRNKERMKKERKNEEKRKKERSVITL